TLHHGHIVPYTLPYDYYRKKVVKKHLTKNGGFLRFLAAAAKEARDFGTEARYASQRGKADTDLAGRPVLESLPESAILRRTTGVYWYKRASWTKRQRFLTCLTSSC